MSKNKPETSESEMESESEEYTPSPHSSGSSEFSTDSSDEQDADDDIRGLVAKKKYNKNTKNNRNNFIKNINQSSNSTIVKTKVKSSLSHFNKCNVIMTKQNEIKDGIAIRLMNHFSVLHKKEYECATKLICNNLFTSMASLVLKDENIEDINFFRNNEKSITFEPEWGHGSQSISTIMVKALLMEEKNANCSIPPPWICPQKTKEDMQEWFNELSDIIK